MLSMNDHASRNILIVFIGSPGNVTKERQIARKAIGRLNKTLRTIGWEIDLRGWEDTLPGHGRPQELINADVRDCHLFIGLLHTRWGSPTGEYSSGFEEEYRLACKLRKESGNLPEIWLFFKKVDQTQAEDPGDQLKQVLRFRKEVEKQREVLFKVLNSTVEWRQNLPDMLLRYVLERYEEARKPPEPGAPVPPPTKVARHFAAEPENGTQAPVPQQLATSLQVAAARAGNPRELSAFESSRLHLFAITALERHLDVRLGVHEANLLYLHRAELVCTDAEREFLYSTVVGQMGGVVPGWFWFSADNIEATRHRLLRLALGSSNEDVRRQAMKLLSAARIPPGIEEPARGKLFDKLLDDPSAEVRRAKVEYVSSVGTRADLPVLHRLSADPDSQVRAHAWQAHAIILAREDPQRVLGDVLEDRQTFFKELAQELATRADSLTTAGLLSAAKHSDPSVRLFAGKLLLARDAITPDFAQGMLNDPSSDLQTLYYPIVLHSDLPVDLDAIPSGIREQIRPALVSRKATEPIASLLQQVDWLDLQGMDAFEALAMYHFSDFADRVRAELQNEFEELRSDSLKRARSHFGPQGQELVDKYAPGSELDSFIRGYYVAAALRALTAHGRSEDVVFGRRYLECSEYRVRVGAIKLLEEFGDESDCTRLLELAKEDHFVREQASRAASALSGRSLSIIQTLLESGDTGLVEVALRILNREEALALKSTVLKLLRHESGVIRLLVLAFLQRSMNHDELKVVFADYPQGKYYYNVICWLDRVLYAPPPLREAYAQELQKIAFRSSGLPE